MSHAGGIQFAVHFEFSASALRPQHPSCKSRRNMAYQTSPESEEYHSLSGNEPEDDEDDAESETMEPPVHPVPAMQAAFEESIVESTADEDLPRLSLERDPEARRQKLLNSKQYDHSLNSRWNQRTTAQHHPLVKLIAQIIFGMHLLQQEQAKSEEEVVKILQTHVNEVDSFLERTSEDFELAIKDIEERIRFLKLPMKHLDVFEIMLDEKKFRTQLLEGNEKIEKIIERTAEAMDAALLDVQTGAMANKELSRYLDRVHDKWPREKRAISDVFGAMRGNEQGWTGYLKDLQVKGKALESNLERLGKVITQMSKLAAAASRRNKAQGDRASAAASASKSAPNSPGLRSKFAPDPAPPPLPGSPPSRSASLNKPLPREPKVVGGAPQVGKANGVHPVPLSQRFESPRQTPQSPPEPRRGPTAANGEIQRPKTADGPVRRKEARAADERANTTELLQFFKAEHSNPLRSNPPSTYKGNDGSARERKPIRSQSQGANIMLDSRVPEKKTHPVGRSMSQSAIEMQSKPKSIPIALPAISENEKPSVYQPSESQSPPRR